MKRKMEVFMAVLVLVAAGIFAKEGAVIVENLKVKQAKTCIVIDAGHGGFDPGKIGVNKAEEKGLNLEIALKLKKLLEAEDIEVVMTRADDNGLYKEGSNNKKVEDMRKRCEVITKAMPVFTISIHQNSYPEEYVRGAQVFYYGQSKEGGELAELIQTSMVKRLDPENNRTAKANDSYYLLKKTPTPTVIVECGFLSNSAEAALLVTEEYQERVAWSIHMGVMQYLSK